MKKVLGKYHFLTNTNISKVILFLILGISSGIPFLTILSTLMFWLTELEFSKTIIGSIVFISLPYSLKPIWAPFIDNYSFFKNTISRLYSVGIIANILLSLSIAGLGLNNPLENLYVTIFFGTLIALNASIQDIVIDSLRIEIVPIDMSAIIATAETIGFRIGMLISGAGSIYIAEYISWPVSYFITASVVSCGSIAFYILKLSGYNKNINFKVIKNNTIKQDNIFYIFINSIKKVILEPYFYLIMLFIFFFKISDSALNSMIAPFLYDIGVNKLEYANIAKFFGTIMVIIGSFNAGYLIHRFNNILVFKIYGILQIICSLMFFSLSLFGYSKIILITTIGIENLTSGIGSVAFLTYLVKFCRPPLTATHFTIIYSCGSFFRVVISFISGLYTDLYGWPCFYFTVCLLSLPFFIFLNKIENYYIDNMQ